MGGNLEAQPDMARVSSLSDYYRARFLYRLSAGGEAVVTVEHNGRSYRGSSVTTDIVESGVRAFLEVVNRIESMRTTAAARAERRNLEAAEASHSV